MTDFLQVLLGLALVNYLMLDVVSMPEKAAPESSSLHKTLVVAGTTMAALLPTLLGSAVLEQWLMSEFASSVLSTLSFCVLLAVVLQCVALVLTRRNIVFASALPIFLPLIFCNCVVVGITMPANNIELDSVLMGGLVRGACFTVILTGFTLFRERLAGADVPVMFRGASTTFFAAALASMILMGFAGLA